VQHCERCGERPVPYSGSAEVHDGVEAAWDTSSEGILGVVGRTSVAAGIDVDDAAEALAVRVDAAQGIASTRAEAASTNLDDSCTEAAAETFAHSP
jgi:hypothetical protein